MMANGSGHWRLEDSCRHEMTAVFYDRRGDRVKCRRRCWVRL